MLFCNFKHIDIIVLYLFFVMVFADRSFSVQIYSERELFQLGQLNRCKHDLIMVTMTVHLLGPEWLNGEH